MSGTQILWKKDRATNLTVRLVQGVSTIQYLNLRPGSSVGPLRVGSAADWCVTGEGVQPLHLSLLFDGTDLFVASVSPAVYVSLNGQPLNAGQWVPVGISSEICFGSAVLHVARGESQPPPGTALDIPAADTGPEATLSDGGRLREIAQRARDAASDTVSAPPPAVSPSAPPAVMPTPLPAAGQPPPAPAQQHQPSAPAPASPPKTKSGSSWSEASLVKKLTLLLLPLAAVGTWFTWDDPAPPPKARRKAPAASASAPSKVAALAKNPAAPVVSATPPRTEGPAASSSAPALSSAVPAASAEVAKTTAPATPADVRAAASASAGVLMIAPGSSDTTPRSAIDAAFAGRLETAKELYAKLAAAHPDKPEYAIAKKRVEENAVRKP
jgi:hypothetical protein